MGAVTCRANRARPAPRRSVPCSAPDATTKSFTRFFNIAGERKLPRVQIYVTTITERAGWRLHALSPVQCDGYRRFDKGKLAMY